MFTAGREFGGLLQTSELGNGWMSHWSSENIFFTVSFTVYVVRLVQILEQRRGKKVNKIRLMKINCSADISSRKY